jgi:signal transduction histidine kinase
LPPEVIVERVETQLIALVALLLTAVPAFFGGIGGGASFPQSVTEAIGLGCLVIGATSMALWRRHPASALVLGCGGTLVCSLTSLQLSDATLLLLPAFALLAAYAWSGRESLVVGLGLLLWVETLSLATGEVGPALLIFTAPGYAAGFLLRRLHDTAAQLEIRSQELDDERELFAELSVRNERARIASELHDILGHSLSVMVVQAAAAQRIAGDDTAAMSEAFEVIADSARQGRDDLGRLVDLLDGEAVVAPDVSLINEVVTRAARSGIAVTCRFEGDCDSIPEPVAHAMFRVVQEGLTNAIRHAPGAAVRVLVRSDGSTLTVGVENDSAVVPATRMAGAGHGLAGLRERVQRLHGAFSAGAVPNGGWAVEAQLPR